VVDKILLYIKYALQAVFLVLLGLVISLFIAEQIVLYIVIGFATIMLFLFVIYFYYKTYRRRLIGAQRRKENSKSF